MKRLLFIGIIAIFSLSLSVQAQNNVGIGTTTPQASALLDLTATDMGLLIPRVTLLAVGNGTSPVNTPATGLLVYNTGGALTAGFYYWDGTQWVQVGAGGGGCTTLDEAYDCGGAGAGYAITADAGEVEITLPTTGTSNSAIEIISNKTSTWSLGATNSSDGVALLADITSTTNTFNAIQGSSFSNYNSGGGIGSGGVAGFYEGTGDGVGVYGGTTIATGSVALAGVFGFNARTDGGFGVNGQGYAGVVGEGVLTTLNCFGVYGSTTRGVGVQGETDDIAYQGVVGRNYFTYGSTGDGIGVMGDGGTGVWGQTTYGDGYGVFGINGSTSGTTNNIGVGGQGWVGVYGSFDNTSGAGGFGVYASGDLGSSGTKSFVIDHPLDPENKILKHYCVESPVPVNMYRGNAKLDQNGEAVVTMPDYFEEININFSYNLTCIGGYANVFIKEKISNGQFIIAGGQPGMEVSWTVYADRNDKYVQQYPESSQTVIDKREHGKYISPELYGAPSSERLFGTPKQQQKLNDLNTETGKVKSQESFHKTDNSSK